MPLTNRRAKRFSATLARFGADRRANVAIMTALLLLPLIGASGLAFDQIVALNGKTKLDQAGDAAALAAIRSASLAIQGGTAPVLALAQAKIFAAQTFSANSGAIYSVNKPTPTVTINLSGSVLTSTVAYTTTGKMNFGQMFGVSTSYIAGTASATSSLPTYINVYLMVDTSGSTSIGASPTDQQALIAKTGCAFACHDGNPVNGYADAYTYAEAIGIQLRYDVINAGIKRFLDTVDSTDPTHQYIRASIYSFDSTLKTLSPLTSNTTQLRQSLPAAPATAGEYDGATHFNEAIPSVLSDIGTGGDGTSAATPKKLLIIATDGVQDPNRTWTYNLSLRPQVQVIDTTFCSGLSSKSVTPAFIHMPYLPMTWDWGYVATLGQPANNGTSQTRVDLVQPALQACAGSFYTPATDTTSLQNAFSKIFSAYVGVRLTN